MFEMGAGGEVRPAAMPRGQQPVPMLARQPSRVPDLLLLHPAASWLPLNGSGEPNAGRLVWCPAAAAGGQRKGQARCSVPAAVAIRVCNVTRDVCTPE